MEGISEITKREVASKVTQIENEIVSNTKEIVRLQNIVEQLITKNISLEEVKTALEADIPKPTIVDIKEL